jgi:hypothetical protein
LSGITNYPIGVGINAAGEITIADNHNNFNLSVFSQEGQLISALESKVKTAGTIVAQNSFPRAIDRRDLHFPSFFYSFFSGETCPVL